MDYLDRKLRDDDTVDDVYADGDVYDPLADRRWRPVAAIAGIVLVLAVIATAVIVNGGDSESTSATVVVPPSRTTAPHLVPALPPETITRLTPSSRPPVAPTTSTPPPVPSATIPPVAPDVAARTFVYRVTGVKALLDLVTVVYTDASGAPQTDFNVSLPWSRTVVLNPGVSTRSVVATSLTGRLNCSIADSVGDNVAMSTSSTMIATCVR